MHFAKLRTLNKIFKVRLIWVQSRHFKIQSVLKVYISSNIDVHT